MTLAPDVTQKQGHDGPDWLRILAEYPVGAGGKKGARDHAAQCRKNGQAMGKPCRVVVDGAETLCQSIEEAASLLGVASSYLRTALSQGHGEYHFRFGGYASRLPKEST